MLSDVHDVLSAKVKFDKGANKYILVTRIKKRNWVEDDEVRVQSF